MKKQYRHLVVVLALLPGLVAFEALGQSNERFGTSALSELTVPVTPRTISLASTMTGGMNGASGVEALISNPAAILVNQSTTAMFSRMNYIADTGVNYFGVAQRFGSSNIGLTVTSWDYGDMYETTVENPENDPNNTWSAATIAVGLTYGRQLTDRIAAGITFKGLSQRIDDIDARTVALDAGMTYIVGESGLRFGVSLRNFGPQFSFNGVGLQQPIVTSSSTVGDYEVPAEIRDVKSELPSMLNFGAVYEREFTSDMTATVLANYRSNSYDVNQYAGGLELNFQNLLFVRGGVDVATEQELVHWSEWNVGGGLSLPIGPSRLMVDYAYRPSKVFSSVNVFAATFTL